MEWFRNQVKSFADVVLIDSRTGVTEMGGVATQHLADVVVMLCGANIESLESSARMANAFVSSAVTTARAGRTLDLIVVPSRIDDHDNEGFNAFLERLDLAFASIPMRALDERNNMNQMLIPYLPAFSFRETLVIGSPEETRGGRRLAEAYYNIQADMLYLAHEDTTLAKGSVRSSPSVSPTVFLAHVREDRAIAEQITSALKSRQIEIVSAVDTRHTRNQQPDSISRADCVAVVVTPAFNKSASIQNEVKHAINLNKPVIPLVASDLELPLVIAERRPLDLREGLETAMNRLAEAIKSFVTEGVREVDRPESAERVVYVSYSTRDGVEAVGRITKFLKNRGIKTWSYTNNVRPGDNSTVQIERALRQAVAMIVILTPAAVGSPWVMAEAHYMLERGIPILPIIIGNLGNINMPVHFSQLASFRLDNLLDAKKLNMIVAKVTTMIGT